MVLVSTLERYVFSYMSEVMKDTICHTMIGVHFFQIKMNFFHLCFQFLGKIIKKYVILSVILSFSFHSFILFQAQQLEFLCNFYENHLVEGSPPPLLGNLEQGGVLYRQRPSRYSFCPILL